MAEYEYKVMFIDIDGSIIDTEIKVITVERSDDPEFDRDEALCEVDDWADDQLERYDAHEHEITLVDAH